MLSFIIYTQSLIITAIYCFISLFFFAWAVIFRYSRLQAYLRIFILYYGKLIVKVGCFPWVRVRYENPFFRKEPAAIYIFNHRSASDPFLVSCIFSGTEAVQGVNAWPMRLPFFGFFARHAGYLDVLSLDYETAGIKCKDLLDRGISIAVFPEGTRSGCSKMNQFHSLFFRIAFDLKIPVVPVAITGNENIPDRSFRMHSGIIRIRKLKRITPEEFASLTPILLKKKVRTALIEETARMEKGL